jgi:hypothetical protein
MPERTIKRQLQDCDAVLASDDGPIFSTVAKLVESTQALHPRGNVKRGASPRPCRTQFGLELDCPRVHLTIQGGQHFMLSVGSGRNRPAARCFALSVFFEPLIPFAGFQDSNFLPPGVLREKVERIVILRAPYHA